MAKSNFASTTIRDVARECGMSVATVSNVINGRKDIVRPETRARVLEAVRKLQYRPPAVERESSVLTRNLGVVMNNISEEPILGNAYFSQLVDGVLREVADLHWSATFFIESMWSDAEQSIREYCDGRCEGLLVIAPAIESGIVSALRDRGVLFVVVGGGNGVAGASSVDVDNFQGGYDATRYLINLGHRSIGHICGHSSQASGAERQAGYLAAMQEAGLGDFCQISTGDYSYNAGCQAMEEWLESSKSSRPTALFAANDDMARAAMDTALEAGVSIPGELSIMGFDAYPNGVRSPIGLTSMRNPLRQIGRRAVHAVVDAAKHRIPLRETIVFPSDLVEGESAGPPPNRQEISHRQRTSSGPNGGTS